MKVLSNHSNVNLYVTIMDLRFTLGLTYTPKPTPGCYISSIGWFACWEYRDAAIPHCRGIWDFSIWTPARQKTGYARGWLKQLIWVLVALSTVVLAKLSPEEIWPWTAIVELLFSISSPKGCFISHREPICMVLEQSKLSLPQSSQCKKSPEVA